MPRSKDPVRRLKESIAEPKFAARPIDWDKCASEDRALEANRATTLGPEICDRPDDAVIRAAFRDWKLDPRNPWHWRLLLFYFADAHSEMCETERKRWDWSQSQLIDLLQRAQSEECTAGSKLKDSELARRLHAKQEYGYQRITVDALRKKLGEARRRWPDAELGLKERA
jgi:hypothetical protein